MASTVKSHGGTKRSRSSSASRDDDDDATYGQAATKRPFAVGSVFNHMLTEPIRSILKRESLEEIAKSRDFTGYVQVNPDDMARCEGKTRTDPYTMMAADFILKSIFGGDIVFKRKHGPEPTPDEARFMAAQWMKVGCSIFQQLWEFGFAAISQVPHSDYMATPVVLEMSQLDVFVRTNVFGQRAWVYRIKSSAMGGSVDPVTQQVREAMSQHGTGVGSGIIPNVMTIGLSPPSKEGHLRSLVRSTLGEADYTKKRLDLQTRAETARAAPPWFAEEAKPPKYKPDEGTNLASTDVLAPGGSKRSLQQQQIDEEDGSAVLLIRKYGAGAVRAAMNKQLREETIHNSGMGVGNRIDVPTSRVVRPATMPEVPTDILSMRLQQLTMVIMTFGVPTGMLLNETANGRSALNEGTERTWAMQLRVLKQFTLSFFYDLYHFMFDSPRQLEFAKKKAPEVATKEELDLVTDVSIMLPGIPSEEKLENYYDKGILPLETYKRYIHANTSIELEDLANVADPPQTEYEPPPPPGSGAAPAKKKKKKKGSSKAAKKKRRATQKSKKPKS